MKPYRLSPLAALTVAGALLVPIASPAQAAAPKRPKTGRWTGMTSQNTTVILDVTRKQVKLIGFAFDCGGKPATTGLQHVPIVRHLVNRKKYAFLATSESAAAYRDEDGGKTVQVGVTGTFKTRSLVKGNVSVAGCGDTVSMTFTAFR